MAITREDVLKALATLPVDAGGTGLVASGRLSEILIGATLLVIVLAAPEGIVGYLRKFEARIRPSPGAGGSGQRPAAHALPGART